MVLKVAFLDRDGTIVRDYPDKQWPLVTHPEYLPGAVEGLRLLQELGFSLILVSNQYLIGEGFITLSQYEQFSGGMVDYLRAQQVKILDTFYCPHSRTSGCDCCKPRPGLITRALKAYPGIDLTASFVVGDRLSDIQLAQEFDLRSFSLGFQANYPNCAAVASLRDVAEHLMEAG